MNSKNEYAYFENKVIQAISLDYQEDNMEALIILPKKEYDINKYIQNFNQEKYDNIINGFTNQKVELYFPKFEIKFKKEIEKVFQELGIKLAFNISTADFSSIIEKEKMKLCIQKIIHSSYIKIDEKGTKAAAITAVVMFRGNRNSKSERSIIMDVNHPFLFIVRNKNLPSGHDILFISKVENLEGKKVGKASEETIKIDNNLKEREKTDYSKLENVIISFNKPVKWYMYIIKLVLKK